MCVFLCFCKCKQLQPVRILTCVDRVMKGSTGGEDKADLARSDGDIALDDDTLCVCDIARDEDTLCPAGVPSPSPPAAVVAPEPV